VHKLAGDGALNNIVRNFGFAAHLRRRNCHHGSQPFSTSNDEMRCEFGQICISGAHRGKQCSLYALAIAIHRPQGKKG
jgi:hypothetical protein